jgi:hypothetical protein
MSGKVSIVDARDADFYSYRTCAQENEKCDCLKGGKIAYGIPKWMEGGNPNTEVVVKESPNGGLSCTNAVFGDPIAGTEKMCWCANPVAGPPVKKSVEHPKKSIEVSLPKKKFEGYKKSIEATLPKKSVEGHKKSVEATLSKKSVEAPKKSVEATLSKKSVEAQKKSVEALKKSVEADFYKKSVEVPKKSIETSVIKKTIDAPKKSVEAIITKKKHEGPKKKTVEPISPVAGKYFVIKT